MLKSDPYREVKSWKRPIHASKALLAKNYLKVLPHIEIIGITGSVGKTLTQNAIYAVFSSFLPHGMDRILTWRFNYSLITDCQSNYGLANSMIFSKS